MSNQTKKRNRTKDPERGHYRQLLPSLFDFQSTSPVEKPLALVMDLLTDSPNPVDLPQSLSPQEQELKLMELLSRTPRLTPNRQAWDIEGQWEESTIPVQPRSVDLLDKQSRLDLRDPNRQLFTPQYQSTPVESSQIGSQPGEIIFVSHHLMPLFEPFVGLKSTRIKLINWDKPACKLSFYSKHIYRLKKEPDEAEKRTAIQSYLNSISEEITALTKKARTSPPRQKSKLDDEITALVEENNRWQTILDNPGEWLLATSNYETGYAYLSVNIKYRQDEGYQNIQNHLLHNQRDKLGATLETRFNIIFINEDEIQREHCMQHKQVEFYLQQFPIRSNTKLTKRDRLYARRLTD